MELPSPKYIRSVTVKNKSPFNYFLFIGLVNLQNQQERIYYNICPFSKKKYEYTYKKDSVEFVEPIISVNISTNECCGKQEEKYNLNANDLNSIVNILITIDEDGNVDSEFI